MSAAVAIGWRGLSPTTQDRLVRDAWLLMAWWIVIGLACSWLLLEVFRLRSPALRYPLMALAMYGFGTVAGMRVWLSTFSRAVRAQPGRFGGVTFLVVSAVGGVTLTLMLPGAASLADIFG